MSRLHSIIRLIRPEQWIKNAFVLAPLIFSRELFDPGPLAVAVRAFVGFCLTAGAVYSLNDLADLESDRAHTTKKLRPLASGELSRGAAMSITLILLAMTGMVTAALPWRYHVVLIAYFLVNVAYSLKLKEVVLLDVFLIASGFMLRVLAGAYAIDVPVSSWIVLCTLFISLFLGFGKRRGELVLSTDNGNLGDRKVLNRYRVRFLDQMLTIAAAGTVISYALYTVAPSTLNVFRTESVIYTTIFVIYGIFRYLYLIHTKGSTENPTVAVTTDGQILLTGILWILACVSLIYTN